MQNMLLGLSLFLLRAVPVIIIILQSNYIGLAPNSRSPRHADSSAVGCLGKQ